MMLGLQHTCDVSRNAPVGTNGRRQLTLIYEGVRCLALPMSTQATLQNGFDLGRGYDFYFDPSADVKVGDKLDFDGDTYIVSGRQNFKVAFVGHIHVTAQQEIG